VKIGVAWSYDQIGAGLGVFRTMTRWVGCRLVVVHSTCAAIGDADIAKEGLSRWLVKVDAVVGTDDRTRKCLVRDPTRGETSTLLLL